VRPGIAAILCLGVTVAAADVYTRADSTSLKQKIEKIVAHGGPAVPARTASARPTPAAAVKPLNTPVTQREVNSYLRYDLKPQVPVGIDEPVITIVGQGRLLGEAVVDLDAVSRANPPKGLLDPMRLLTGKLPVRVQGVLTTSRGTGRFELESAHVAGVPVPKSLLQQLVSFYSRSADRPQGVGIDDPFELPAAIREIRVEPGQAIVVQ
jgi:hypothetical protein